MIQIRELFILNFDSLGTFLLHIHIIYILFKSSLNQAADLLKSGINPVEIFTIGIGSKYNKNELKNIATSQSYNYMHVDEFESLFSITNDLVQRVCSVQAEIEFNVKVNVTCMEGEMRYFKASTKHLTKDFVAIYKNQNKGDAILYHSFTYKNPNSFYSDAFEQQQEKMLSSSSRIEFPSEFFYLEKNPEEYVYVSMQCVYKENDIQLLLQNEDL